MRNRFTTATAVLAAALLLALSVTAAASRLSYSAKEFRIMWASLSFSAAEGGVSITCPVTLEGSFLERTSTKVRDALAARITSATVGTLPGRQRDDPKPRRCRGKSPISRSPGRYPT